MPPRLGLLRGASYVDYFRDLWQALPMGNKDAHHREKKKPKKEKPKIQPFNQVTTRIAQKTPENRPVSPVNPVNNQG